MTGLCISVAVRYIEDGVFALRTTVSHGLILITATTEIFTLSHTTSEGTGSLVELAINWAFALVYLAWSYFVWAYVGVVSAVVCAVSLRFDGACVASE